MALFRQLFDDDTSTFTYLIADEVTRDALLIDPVDKQVERDMQVLKELDLNLRYIVETHVHADHITGGGLLRKLTGAKFVAGKGTALDCADILLEDGESLEFGNERLIAIATPGHTDGCTSYRWRDRLFTGDTLLIDACGRTDFQQGNSEKLYDSIHKLLRQGDDMLVFPAHDYNGRRVSTIGQEKAINPYVAGLSREEFVAKMAALNLPKPRYIDRAVPANQRCGEVV